MSPSATSLTTQRRAPSMLKALERVLSPSGFPYGSNGLLFRDARFGRDALETAEDLLEMRPDIARAVIVGLAALQGTGVDSRTEEEPGKIHHEYRALVMDGRPIADSSAAIFRKLARGWHMAASEEDLEGLTELINYYTVDATPLYVRLVARFVARYGSGILDETYAPRHTSNAADRRTIRRSVHAAAEWIAGKVEQSGLGLLEWQRQTPWAHPFQAWKDGATSYLHEDGTFGNYTRPMASIEVQGLAYDALVAAASLPDGTSPETRARYAALAHTLQQHTLQRFWMADRRYFALALDRDPENGDVRQLRILTSNPGALLDSSLFDTLTAAERRIYVAPVVEQLFSDEFLTPVGVRASSLRHRDLLDYHAYQSSYTVWHKETYDIAKGLHRQGFPGLAAELEHRMLNGINLAGGAREFLYVLPDNRVDYGAADGRAVSRAVEIRGTNVPEHDQAWTIAAALAAKWRAGRHFRPQIPITPEHAALQEQLLRKAGRVRLLRTVSEIEQARPTDYVCRVNTRKGWERERAWIRRHELRGTG